MGCGELAHQLRVQPAIKISEEKRSRTWRRTEKDMWDSLVGGREREKFCDYNLKKAKIKIAKSKNKNCSQSPTPPHLALPAQRILLKLQLSCWKLACLAFWPPSHPCSWGSTTCSTNFSKSKWSQHKGKPSTEEFWQESFSPQCQGENMYEGVEHLSSSTAWTVLPLFLFLLRILQNYVKYLMHDWKQQVAYMIW